MSTGWIVLGVIVVLVFLAFSAYNRLVALGQRVGQAFADIDVQLKQRHQAVVGAEGEQHEDDDDAENDPAGRHGELLKGKKAGARVDQIGAG